MKSIVEEASSVTKAIEKGWIQAGKPQEFSIKVFEVEEKNFIGMTTKSAKIAIFYNEKQGEKSYTRPDNYERRQQHQPKHDNRPAKKEHGHRSETTTTQRPLPVKKEEKRELKEQAPRETWSDEMVTFAQGWLKETVRLMNLQNQAFSVEVKNYYLKINFEKPLLDDSEKEKLLFRSFAHLVMQSLRNKFKKGFRGFKVILNSGK